MNESIHYCYSHDHYEWDSQWEHHIPYLGWSCRGCYKSSSDFPRGTTFSEHKCSNIEGWNKVLYAICMAVFVFVAIVLVMN